MRELLAHHDKRLEATRNAVERGADIGLAVARALGWTRRERRLDDLDVFNQILAVSETITHLDLLVDRGVLTATVADGVVHYAAITAQATEKAKLSAGQGGDVVTRSPTPEHHGLWAHIPARSRAGPRHQAAAGGTASRATETAAVTLDDDSLLAELGQDDNGTPGPRSKLTEILDVAVREFGEVGYEATKWASIASQVGIGQTALYHYFESKAHCLLTIERMELVQYHEGIVDAVHDAPSATEALRAAVRSSFDVSDNEVNRRRILLFNGWVLANPSASERVEKERLVCRRLMSETEHLWVDLLDQGVANGEFPKREMRLLAAALLGLINSVWRWYRPDGPLSLPAVADVYEEACLRIVLG